MTRTYWVVSVTGLALIAGLLACSNPTSTEQKTDGEWIRESLATDPDAAAAFTTDWLADQVGTSDFARTIDSVHRGFVNYQFYTDSIETQGAKPAFQATVYDSIWGSLSYRIGTSMYTYKYLKFLYSGKARLLKLGGTVSDPNPWRLWRMEERYGNQPGLTAPIIQSITFSSGGQTHSPFPRTLVRLFRDSVLTVAADSLVSVTVALQTINPDDSFFVTYPRDGAFLTQAMTHDSLTHTATVQVRSGDRFGVIGVQGFKRTPFYTAGVFGGAATSVQTALIRFYSPALAREAAP